MEEWRDIEGYEGLYQVSNEGRVRSLNYHLTKKSKDLKQFLTPKGYLTVTLCDKQKMKTYSVHRLVAKAFIPNPNNLLEVNHKNEDKTDNRVFINHDGSVDESKSNLEWCDRKYNMNYGTCLQRACDKLTNGKKSKQVYQYTLDGELVNVWASTQECKRNGFSQGHIASCCRNEYGKKTHKGYKWSYNPL